MASLEVRQGEVVQARRFANDKPTPQDRQVIMAWARANRPTLAQHL